MIRESVYVLDAGKVTVDGRARTPDGSRWSTCRLIIDCRLRRVKLLGQRQTIMITITIRMLRAQPVWYKVLLEVRSRGNRFESIAGKISGKIRC